MSEPTTRVRKVKHCGDFVCAGDSEDDLDGQNNASSPTGTSTAPSVSDSGPGVQVRLVSKFPFNSHACILNASECMRVRSS
jgi:hypothetical protein